MAFFSEKTAGNWDVVIALLEDESAGDETSAPLIFFRTALAAISGDVFLGNAVNYRANSGPHASAGAHGAGLMRGVEDEVWQVAAITAGNIFERFQLHVFDAGARSFYAVTGAGNDHFAPARKACDHSANGIVAAVAGAFGLRNSKLHEFLSRFVGSRDHADRL